MEPMREPVDRAEAMDTTTWTDIVVADSTVITMQKYHRKSSPSGKVGIGFFQLDKSINIEMVVLWPHVWLTKHHIIDSSLTD